MKKTILRASVLGSILTASLIANDATIYANGVKDAFGISAEYFKDKTVFTDKRAKRVLNGYLTYIEATNMNEAEIVRVTSIGIKNGYDVQYYRMENEDIISFGVSERKPDAIFIQQRLSSFNIVSKVLKVNVEVINIHLIGKAVISAVMKNIKNVNQEYKDRILTLETYIKEIAKNDEKDYFPNIEKDPNFYKKPQANKPSSGASDVQLVDMPAPIIKQIIDVSSLQVVNRVVSKKYLEKYARGSISNIEPLNDYAKKHITIEQVDEQIAVVGTNIKDDIANNKPLPKFKTLNDLYTYVREHGAINKDNMLVVNGKAYKEGEEFSGDWVLQKISYKLGVLVVVERYLVGVKKD